MKNTPLRKILGKIGLVLEKDYDNLHRLYNNVCHDNLRLISKIDEIAKDHTNSIPNILTRLSISKNDSVYESETIHLDSNHMRIQVEPRLIKYLGANDEYKESFIRNLSHKWAEFSMHQLMKALEKKNEN